MSSRKTTSTQKTAKGTASSRTSEARSHHISGLRAGLDWPGFRSAYSSAVGGASRKGLSKAWATYKRIHGITPAKKGVTKKAAAKPKARAAAKHAAPKATGTHKTSAPKSASKSAPKTEHKTSATHKTVTPKSATKAKTPSTKGG